MMGFACPQAGLLLCITIDLQTPGLQACALLGGPRHCVSLAGPDSAFCLDSTCSDLALGASR